MKKLLASMVVMLVSLAASAQITWNVKLGGGIAMCTGDVENTKNIFDFISPKQPKTPQKNLKRKCISQKLSKIKKN